MRRIVGDQFQPMSHGGSGDPEIVGSDELVVAALNPES